MAPGVIGIKLQAVPAPLAQVYLQSIVVRVSLSHRVARGTSKTLRVRIGLEIVDRITRPCGVEHSWGYIRRARAESGADQIAEIRCRSTDAGQGTCHRSGLPCLQLGNEIAVAIVGCVTVGACCGELSARLEGSRKYGRRLLAGQPVIGKRPLVGGVAAGVVDRQVRLRTLELGEKAVRELTSSPENIDFIRVDIEPLA